MRSGLNGAGELDRTFARMIGAVMPQRAEAAAIAAGEVFADEMRRLVHRRSGNLHDSIVVSTESLNYSARALNGFSAKVFVGPSKGGHPDGFYGHLEEFGTFHSPAHPFVAPAFENKREEAQDVLVARMWRGIEQAARAG